MLEMLKPPKIAYVLIRRYMF